MSVLTVADLLAKHERPLIDVRSPSEFRKGHIPGAVSIPLFDDSERAEVGTLYKQVGREQAVARGLEFASAKASQLVQQVQNQVGNTEFILHCWRGGMRSRGVAWLCEDCGLHPNLLEGGYKSFRQAAHHSFRQPQRIILLAGPTGAGKTRLLQSLRAAGQQIIDLECLARHRGSVFGGLDRAPQPTVEQFENDLFLQWQTLDPCRPVWIEGESRTIGQIIIPEFVWEQMSAAPAIFVEVNRDQRLDFLLREYGELPHSDLAAAVQRLKKRLGGDRLNAALAAIDRDDRRTFAEIALDYYDKSYSKALQKRPSETVIKFSLPAPGDPQSIDSLIATAESTLGSRGKASRSDGCFVG